MCRLFGQISPTPQSAKDFLVDAKYSLLYQSDHKPKNLQKDGWGLGSIDGGRVHVVKSAGAIFKEAGRFKSVAGKIQSKIVIAHIRAASNPQGLPFRRLIARENSQPFTDGKIIFAHNGTVNIPLEVAKFLGPYQRRIRGVNDSEVYFWQFKKFYDAYGDIPKALQACIGELWVLWKACKVRYPKKKGPY